MVFQRIPLRVLVEQRMKWSEFVRLAKLPKKERPSYRSMHIIYGPDERTMKSWFERYDKGERK